MWSGDDRKCSAAVVGLILMLGLSMVRWCSLNRSFKRHLQHTGETKRRFKDQFNQRRRIEKILLYLKRAGLAGRNSAPSKQSSYVVSVSAFILFRVYFVWECDGELIYYPKDLAWRLAVFFCTLRK